MQKGNWMQRVLQFAESKGFYMILGLCVLAIGVSTYVLFFTTPEAQPLTGRVVEETPPAEASGQAPEVTVPEKTTPAKPQPTTQTQKTPEPAANEPAAPQQTPIESKPTAAEVPEAPANAVEVDAKTTVKQPIFTLPVREASIQREYSGDTLVADPTMGDWRTHNGIDFSCDEGDAVMAVLDGSVTEITKDALLGTCIRIDHGAGLESRYCGLVADDSLKVGASVSVGQTIGRADNSNLSESAQECHLHLEMTEDGLFVDPLSILK